MREPKRTAPRPAVVRGGRVLGGAPVFRGTRVPVDVLFDNLADGYSVDEILEEFPTLDREQLKRALSQACEALKTAAPDLSEERAEPARARVP